jgi:hypothetical protein
VGTNAGLFEADDVLNRAVLGTPDRTPGPQLPAEADAMEGVEHRLVIHDIRRRDERLQDNARLAAIDDIVVVIAEPTGVRWP